MSCKTQVLAVFPNAFCKMHGIVGLFLKPNKRYVVSIREMHYLGAHRSAHKAWESAWYYVQKHIAMKMGMDVSNMQ